MRYQRVRWTHDFVDEPTVLFAEIDDEGWEVRKVNVYRDGPSSERDREKRRSARAWARSLFRQSTRSMRMRSSPGVHHVRGVRDDLV